MKFLDSTETLALIRLASFLMRNIKAMRFFLLRYSLTLSPVAKQAEPGGSDPSDHPYAECCLLRTLGTYRTRGPEVRNLFSEAF